MPIEKYIWTQIETFKFHWKLKIKNEKPVIIYTMGKVGTGTLVNSLKQSGVDFVIPVHRMSPSNIEMVRQEYLAAGLVPQEKIGQMLYDHVVRKNKEAYYLSLVRDPIARNISAFFQNFKRFMGVDFNSSNHSVDDISKKFINDYVHNVPIEWFDLEIKAALGIDIYEFPFPKEKGYQLIEQGDIKLLILKLELSDLLKENAIKEFLRLLDFNIKLANVGKNKDYSAVYSELINSIRLPSQYVEKMYQSSYVKHFYTDDEIDGFQRRWSE